MMALPRHPHLALAPPSFLFSASTTMLNFAHPETKRSTTLGMLRPHGAARRPISLTTGNASLDRPTTLLSTPNQNGRLA